LEARDVRWAYLINIEENVVVITQVITAIHREFARVMILPLLSNDVDDT
jgi:hypothetical protein